MYLFTRWDVQNEWIVATQRAGFELKNAIVWDRVVHGMGDLTGAYAPCYDTILFATKGRHVLRGKRPIDIISIPRLHGEALVHPTEKPVPLLEKLILSSSDSGDVVLDPFAGSGTTGMAALRVGRRFVGMEIDSKYHEIASARLHEHKTHEDFF